MSSPAQSAADSAAEPIPQNSPKFPNGENHAIDKPLSEQQLRACAAMLAGKSFTQVASEIGIDRKTLYHWRRDPEFIAELRKRRRELWQHAADHMRALLHPAIEVLAKDMNEGCEDERFRAAATILRLSNLRSAVPIAEEDGDDM